MWAKGQYVRFSRNGAIGFVSDYVICEGQVSGFNMVLVEYIGPVKVRIWENERNIELIDEEEAALGILGCIGWDA